VDFEVSRFNPRVTFASPGDFEVSRFNCSVCIYIILMCVCLSAIAGAGSYIYYINMCLSTIVGAGSVRCQGPGDAHDGD